MALRKCPRCELNYILDDQPYCPVCRRELKGEQEKDSPFETCSICNENPALPGKDLCLFCLKEMETEKGVVKDDKPMEPPLTLDDASEMEEIAIDTDAEDEPDPEIGEEIDRELSLDEVLAEEEANGDESEEEPEEDV